MTRTITDPPYGVGRFYDGEGEQFLPFSYAEMQRQVWFYCAVLAGFQLLPRKTALVVSNFSDGALSLPLESALEAATLIPTYAEATSFDAVRVEALIRRFDMTAVFGINENCLAGLESLGFLPEALFSGRVVWARGEAVYQQLVQYNTFTTRRWMELGPVHAMECQYGGGLHYDPLEWRIESDQGELVVSSRQGRCKSFDELATGIMAHIDPSPCACGNASPRVQPLR